MFFFEDNRASAIENKAIRPPFQLDRRPDCYL